MKDVSISIDPEKLSRARKTILVGGSRAEISVSPFSTPKEVIGRLDPAAPAFVIEFRYVDAEPPGPAPVNYEGIQIVQGKYSRKILSIRIPLATPLELNRVATLWPKLREALAYRRHRIFREGAVAGAADELNQEVAEEILDDEENRRAFEPQLAGAP